MTLRIRAVREKGNPEKERIVLTAESSEDIGQYILFCTHYEGDDSVSAKVRNTLWLPDQKVEAGDLVVIYTKKSTNLIKIKENDDNTKTIFIYWGLGGTIWNKGEDAAVLVKMDSWSWKKA